MKSIRAIGREAKTYRIEALSDAVIAIVMTILVIELAIPEVPKLLAAEQLHLKLIEMWPKFAAYGLSFLVLGTLWSFHHIMFIYTKRVDGKYTWLNIFFLMFVALIPFSTALIGEYTVLGSTAVVFYGSNAFMIMLILNLMWWYVTRGKRLVDKNMKSIEIKQLRIRFLVAAILFLVAIGLSFISPYIGIALYFILTIWAIIEILISEPKHSNT